MKKFYIALSVLISVQLNAQISLSKQHFATKGDSERMSSASASSQIDLNTGADYVWDFSHLTAESQLVEEYGSISSLGAVGNLQFGSFAPDKYKASYFILNQDVPLQYLPSFLPITFSDYNNIMQLTDDSLSLVGVTVSINGQSLPIRYSDIEAQFYFPVSYGDHYTTYGKFDQNMNPIYDAQWKQKREHEVDVDGWGKVTTTLGTFDALRIKHTIVEQDSIYASINGFGMWLPLNIPTQVIYEWRTLEEKSPVVRIKANIVGGNEVVRSVQFRDNVVLGTENLLDEELSVYPNPVENVLNISTGLFDKYKIMTIDGKQVLSGSVTNEINCSDLNSGTYIIQLTADTTVKNITFVKR